MESGAMRHNSPALASLVPLIGDPYALFGVGWIEDGDAQVLRSSLNAALTSRGRYRYGLIAAGRAGRKRRLRLR